eukprot:TRINITY_DN11591_c0_g1_i4.p1 TRINITY_DN11591_c0_g1~~TRINITY_DN11591_c0_g1_i4.p1  ORF type:complete len:629 (+),score=144.85 TRINITY_DN11591_c0_g1_i4:86-1972(+)
MQYKSICLAVHLLALVFTQTYAEPTDECIKGLQDYANHFLRDKSIISLFMYTGKEANDLGDHKNCVKNYGNYLVANFKKTHVPTVSLGLCVPLSCNTTHMQNYKETLVSIINNMLTEYNFTEQEASVYDPSALNKSVSGIGPGFYTLCALFLIVLLLLVAGQIRGRPQHSPSQQNALDCFNFVNNASALFCDKAHPEDFTNGLRVVAMMWVIVGQSLMVTLKAPMYNLEEVEKVVRRERLFGIIVTAPWAVDVFLCISGFFSSISAFHALKEKKSVLTVLKLYLYRYLRLVPIYGLGIMISIFVIPILNNGPIYSRVAELRSNCSTNVYWNFLMLNNFISVSKLCLSWSWYVALDFQLSLIAPLLTLLFLKSSKAGYISVVGVIGVSILLQVILAVVYNLNIYHILDSHRVRQDLFEIILTKPYCHIDTYLLGMLAAWLYLTHDSVNEFLKKSRCARYVLYVFGVAATCTTFFTFPSFYNSSPKLIAFSSIYMALSRLLFVLGLLAALYPALLGKCRGSVVLSIEFWGPLAKSTYSAYIFHFTLFMFYVMTLEEGVFFSFHKLVRNAVDVVVLMYIAAVVLTLLVDLPLRRFWKHVLNLRREEKLNTTECLINEEGDKKCLIEETEEL